MKISDFKNEDAIDLLADIMEPAARILADAELSKMYKNGTPKLLLAKSMLKNHKSEVIEIVARLNGEEPKEYNFTVMSLTKTLLDILNDEDMKDFFTYQVETMGEKSFTSVTENTEDGEQ